MLSTPSEVVKEHPGHDDSYNVTHLVKEHPGNDSSMKFNVPFNGVNVGALRGGAS